MKCLKDIGYIIQYKMEYDGINLFGKNNHKVRTMYFDLLLSSGQTLYNFILISSL